MYKYQRLQAESQHALVDDSAHIGPAAAVHIFVYVCVCVCRSGRTRNMVKTIANH